MECIVLAGGLGTRLRSVVSDLPKCMASVAAHPFLFYIFKYLVREKATHVILSVGYKYEAIERWVRQQNWPFLISYVIEKEPLGTGGAIKLALKKAIEEQVFILNGDTFFDVNLAILHDEHQLNQADLSIALKPMTNFDRYGNVLLNAKNRIVSFQEKQYCEKGNINGGIYLLNKKNHLMDNVESRFSFESDILQKHFIGHYFHGVICDKYFIDIGIPEDYQIANSDFKTLLK